MLQSAPAVLRARQFPRDSKSRVAARQFAEPIDQRLTGKFRLDRFLEDVPQRHVEIVEIAGSEQLAGKLALFSQLQTETFGRQPKAQLKIRACARTNALNDVEHDARAILERTA